MGIENTHYEILMLWIGIAAHISISIPQGFFVETVTS